MTRFDENGGKSVNYEPNSFWGPTHDLFRLMTADAKARLISNIVGSLGQTPRRIQELQIQHFYKADPAYGGDVAKDLGLDISAIVANWQAEAAD
jgi:catalase